MERIESLFHDIPEVPSMKALRVAKPKKQEMLESTWKIITEGRHVPLTRHLKKSDTGEHHAPPAINHAPKSETFKEHSTYRSPPPKIRKDPSLNQEELNQRVEAFINKVNEEMRMQRIPPQEVYPSIGLLPLVWILNCCGFPKQSSIPLKSLRSAIGKNCVFPASMRHNMCI